MPRQPAIHFVQLHPAFCPVTLTSLLATGLWLAQCASSPAQPAFNYSPIGSPILGASLSINFAALTANRFVGSTEVNRLQLWDVSGNASVDLSQALFGTAPWPSPPPVNQGPLQTGFVTANISPSFFSI